jgi:hypothetical protein
MMKLPPIEIKDQAEITLDDLGPIQLAIYKGITSLDSDGNFHPQADITRAQAADMIYNALKYIHPAPKSTDAAPRVGSSQPMIRVVGQKGQVDQTVASLDDKVGKMTAGSIVYENSQYGFRFTLPDNWEGYTIVTDKWEGLSLGDSQGEKVVESGPKISIRHPAWTSEQPRQDMPILVFTVA